ncbi:uncharacterized protein BCR38DRAFT_509981 [Pseudomassariella vexata]|uniref:Uncharacterized protein n=1 Tax=Pseudomassariella vexata TaxID=1141098 RepID=A0A1Y2E6S2_9PEZI|nr:uncharacterized protein BCR38DRAFT_509981 [Pseudomassariella vexata]ORY67251.1 hypothetical protein BCR38DRAFT_509981 [Pseudomassariella vexata]
MEEVQKSCQYWSCRRGLSKVINVNEGCLQRKALMRVTNLIAHVTVDSFCCKDVSLVSGVKLENIGVFQVLAALAEGEMKWNDWFGVAARAFVGCPLSPCRSIWRHYHHCAMAGYVNKHGTQRIILHGGHRRLGVLAGGLGEFRIQGVKGDFAVIDASDTKVMIARTMEKVQASILKANPERYHQPQSLQTLASGCHRQSFAPDGPKQRHSSSSATKEPNDM